MSRTTRNSAVTGAAWHKKAGTSPMGPGKGYGAGSRVSSGLYSDAVGGVSLLHEDLRSLQAVKVVFPVQSVGVSGGEHPAPESLQSG
jgi:hypothetical protein